MLRHFNIYKKAQRHRVVRAQRECIPHFQIKVEAEKKDSLNLILVPVKICAFILIIGLILGCGLHIFSQQEKIYRIAIVELQNNSGITLRGKSEVGPDQLGKAIADDISFRLAKDKEFEILPPQVVEEKVLLKLGVGKGFYTNPKFVLKAGKILNCDFIIGGEIYNVESSLQRKIFSKSWEAKLKAKVYLINANSGEIVYVTMLEGKGKGKAKFYSDLNKREIIVKAAAELSNKIYENIIYFIKPEKMITTEIKKKP